MTTRFTKILGLLALVGMLLMPMAAAADDIGVQFTVTGGALSWATPPQATVTLTQPFGAATGPWVTLSNIVVSDYTGVANHAHYLTLATATLPANAHIVAGDAAMVGTCMKADDSGACTGSGALVRVWGMKEVTGTPQTYAGWSAGTVAEAAKYTYASIGIVSASPTLPVGSSNGGVLKVVLVSGPPA